jgi:hypothetical protein
MLLQLENTSYANVKKLLEYARELNLNLRLVDQDESNPTLPGKPLSETALKALIENSRKSGSITMDVAHNIIRKNFHAD